MHPATVGLYHYCDKFLPDRTFVFVVRTQCERNRAHLFPTSQWMAKTWLCAYPQRRQGRADASRTETDKIAGADVSGR